MDQTATSLGLYESLLTPALQEVLASLSDTALASEITDLAGAEASDRVSRHVARLLARAIETLPERDRAAGAARIAAEVLSHLDGLMSGADLGIEADTPLPSAQVLSAILRRAPDGSIHALERPLTPLLDTTVLTNAPGEPAVAHEIRAEVPSSDRIDVLMAFIRFSGIRRLLDHLRRHCQDGRQLRVLTTTYTNSTEQRALDELIAVGAEVRVSYDTTTTRLHAKAWMFHRASGYSTAYLGSSNLTYSAQVTGVEWNVRLSQARNPDAVDKMAAVFESYWASADFVPYDAAEFRAQTAVAEPGPELILSPLEVVLRPFQEQMLDQLALARHRDHHANLLVSATGTGKTVMAAVDYSRLRASLPRDRLLFVAHREEILEQSRNTFRHVMRDATFGELWVGRHRPERFEHVFASIQSLNSAGLDSIDPGHFDVLIIDEFHHAAAASYERLLERAKPRELLGLTATPERADGVDILHNFGGRIAAELRLWDAVDQQRLAPFDYFGIHDGLDLSEVPWRRGRGYDPVALTNVLTADDVWANRVLEQVRQKIADPRNMRAIGFCVSVGHAIFMAERFRNAGLSAVAVSGDSNEAERRRALRDLAAGTLQVVFAVDLFNEGVDVPSVDTLLMLRPTESATLFIQQLGRGLRRHDGKTTCTVLDFVGQQRREFRYDRRYRALLGGSRKDVEGQIKAGFPFLPTGCSLELDPVAREIVLRSIREAIPTRWPEKCGELRSLGDVSLRTYLEETGLDLEDIYAGDRSWTEMRRAAGLDSRVGDADEARCLRAVGRMLHVDDDERINFCRSVLAEDYAPPAASMSERDRRLFRMLLASVTTSGAGSSMEEAAQQLWQMPAVRAELAAVLECLPDRVDHVNPPVDLPDGIPLRVHARYTRLEILAAFGVGDGARPPDWREGVRYVAEARSDLFAFTLDKSSGGFSPTTRYRDYAISPRLVHWESQSGTSSSSPTGRRYIAHAEEDSKIVMFARLHSDERAFWCLGTARYVSHEGDRPISFVWRLDQPLPPDLYTAFAAAAA